MPTITGKTKLIGIFGYPVEHSFSPVMHNKAFAHLDLDYCYTPFAVKPDDVERAVKAIRALGIVGVNVTIPHKEAVLPYLDVLSQEARIIGAVNTIVNHDGRLTGYNTDGQGFVQSMKEEANTIPKDKTVTILGAGGAARAVAVQIALAGAIKINIINRNTSRGEAIKSIISSNSGCRTEVLPFEIKVLQDVMPKTDILINTTPVGMYPNITEGPVIPSELIHKEMLVCDLIYNPAETTLLKAAKQAGAKVLPGLGMLLYQGALGFKLWTGQEPPVDVMREALREYLGL